MRKLKGVILRLVSLQNQFILSWKRFNIYKCHLVIGFLRKILWYLIYNVVVEGWAFEFADGFQWSMEDTNLIVVMQSVTRENDKEKKRLHL